MKLNGVEKFLDIILLFYFLLNYQPEYKKVKSDTLHFKLKNIII